MDSIVDGPQLLIERVDRIDSTNSELLRREPLLPSGSPATAVWLVAATQTDGRGRRSRNWLSTQRASLTASLGYERTQPSHLGSLSLAAGVAVAETLASFGVEVRLKWPNDLHVAGGKAGGILCEARARGGATRIVVGCGLNLLAPASTADFGQPVAGLFEPGALPDHAVLSGAIGRALWGACLQLHEQGFEAFRRRWVDRDLLCGRAILIHDYDGARASIARGIDQDGALLVTQDDDPTIRRLRAEEVSVRPLPDENATVGGDAGKDGANS